jgi:fructose-specific phosphotransferase system IIC component
MKFVNKVMKSKYFGPVVSTILVILAIYVLYRLVNNATEGMDQFLMKSDDKFRRVVGKILLLGPQKLGQFATSIPQDIQNIMK